MLLTAIGIFALTSLLGMMLIYNLLYSHQAQTGLIVLHNIVATAGMMLLTFYTLAATIRPLESLLLLLLAVLGGLFMAYRDLMGRLVPKWLAFLQEFVTLSGFSLLIYSASQILPTGR